MEPAQGPIATSLPQALGTCLVEMEDVLDAWEGAGGAGGRGGMLGVACGIEGKAS